MIASGGLSAIAGFLVWFRLAVLQCNDGPERSLSRMTCYVLSETSNPYLLKTRTPFSPSSRRHTTADNADPIQRQLCYNVLYISTQSAGQAPRQGSVAAGRTPAGRMIAFGSDRLA